MRALRENKNNISEETWEEQMKQVRDQRFEVLEILYMY